jgi:ATP-binding cassette subfamily B multidrug efflux pump
MAEERPQAGDPEMRGGVGGPRGMGDPRRMMMVGGVEKAENIGGTVRRMMSYLGNYTSTILGVVILVIATTGFDILGPYLMGVAIDTYIINEDLPGLVHIVLLMIGIGVAMALTSWLQVYVMAGVSQRAVRDMRNDFFTKLQSLPLRFFDQKARGDIMSRLTNDVDNISSILTESVTSLITSVLTVIGVTAMMLWLNVPLALISLITFPLMSSLISQVAKYARRGFREQQQALGTLNGVIEETITGERVVIAYGRSDSAIENFKKSNDKLTQVATRAQFFGTLMPPLTFFVNNTGLAVVAFAGGYMAVQGDVTVGVIAAFISYVRQFGRPLGQIANLYNTIQSAIAGAERVFETIDEIPEPPDTPAAIALYKVDGDVLFDKVSFSYEKNAPVLKNVSLHVKPGKTFALVGPTGAGKTTIVNLLTRFYDIDSGTIHIDGHEIQQIKRESLRRQLGIVLQDTFLFTGTVMENIRYGRLNATDDEVIEAAKLANADTFIHHLPQGYDTQLSERGSNLSQGQRQMLSIARAILADPAILILDEATSSVDTRTEMNIQQALLRLMEGRTSFVIAHRLSTIRNVDQILVINDGEIIERGSHEELLDAQGFYHNLYMSQFKGEVIV